MRPHNETISNGMYTFRGASEGLRADAHSEPHTQRKILSCCRGAKIKRLSHTGSTVITGD